MIIKRKVIEIPDLSVLVLEACPLDRGTHFKKGYLEFVDSFFGDLDILTNALSDEYGNFNTDLNVFLEQSLEEVERSLILIPLTERKSYWTGVTSAVEKSLQTLQLAYETIDTKKAS